MDNDMLMLEHHSGESEMDDDEYERRVKTAPVAPVAEVPEPAVSTPIVSVDYDAAARLA